MHKYGDFLLCDVYRIARHMYVRQSARQREGSRLHIHKQGLCPIFKVESSAILRPCFGP